MKTLHFLGADAAYTIQRVPTKKREHHRIRIDMILSIHVCLGSAIFLPSIFPQSTNIIIIIIKMISPVDSSISRWYIIYYDLLPYSVLCIILLLLHFFSPVNYYIVHIIMNYDHWSSRPWTISGVSLIARFYVFVLRLFVFRISRSNVAQNIPIDTYAEIEIRNSDGDSGYYNTRIQDMKYNYRIVQESNVMELWVDLKNSIKNNCHIFRFAVKVTSVLYLLVCTDVFFRCRFFAI